MKQIRPRVIPVLLLSGDGLVKTTQFDKAKYIGDPINAVKIFNDSEVDEIILLDVSSRRQKGEPQFEVLKEIHPNDALEYSFEHLHLLWQDRFCRRCLKRPTLHKVHLLILQVSQ